MERELRIESDEAYDLAHDLAQRLDVTPRKAVEFALREYKNGLKPAPSAQDKAASIEEVLALGARARAKLAGRSVPDPNELLYDERGLPR